MRQFQICSWVLDVSLAAVALRIHSVGFWSRLLGADMLSAGLLLLRTHADLGSQFFGHVVAEP